MISKVNVKIQLNSSKLFVFIEEYRIGRTTFIINNFWLLIIFEALYLFKVCPNFGILFYHFNSQYFWKWTNAIPMKFFGQAATASKL